MILHLVSILFLFLLFFFISLSSYSKLFVASGFIVLLFLFLFLVWWSALQTYNSSSLTSHNFWKNHCNLWRFVLFSFPYFLWNYLITFWPFIQFVLLASFSFWINFSGLDSLQSLSFSVNFDPSILTQLSFYFDFSLFDLADSFYLETLGGVVECESPNLIDRGFISYIGNCCGLGGKSVSSSGTVPMVYSPPNLQSNETLPSYSSLLSPARSPLPSPVPVVVPSSTCTDLVPVVVPSSTCTDLVPYSPPARSPLPFFLTSPYLSNPLFIVPVGDFSFSNLPFIRCSIIPFVPFPSISECPHFVLWEGNFYSSIPNYVPVEGGTSYSILPVVGRGPRSPCSISDWRLYPYHPDVFYADMYFSRLGGNLQGHASLLSHVFPSFSFNNLAISTVLDSLTNFYPNFHLAPCYDPSIHLASPLASRQLLTVMDTQRIILPLLNSIVDHVARCGEI